MKKLLITALLLTVVSCTYQNQKFKLNIQLDSQKSEIGKGTKIDLVVLDDRKSKLLGSKEFGSGEVIKISSRKNIAKLLRKKIAKNLRRKGFKKGDDKKVEIHISSLNYQAKRKFFIGESSANISIKIIIKNNKDGSIFSKNFISSLDSKHFILPLNSTDRTTITNIIQETVQKILNDQEILSKLTN